MKRDDSEARQFDSGALGKPAVHESAHLHVTGRALYGDDIPEIAGTLHAAIGTSPVAHGRLRGLSLEAVRASPGVVGVFTAADIAGHNNYGSIVHDDPVFAASELCHLGQPVFAVVAHSAAQARYAARQAVMDIAPLPAILNIEEALAQQSFVRPSVVHTHGDCAGVMARASRRLRRRFNVGGQEHFYLEGQVAYAQPSEGGELVLWSSTQHPGEVQRLVADMLATPLHNVNVLCRRMGGAFGGKETQAALFACIAALCAVRTGQPVKLRLDRDDDFMLTGKRHAFLFDYEVGFGDDGKVSAFDVTMAANCGYSADLSGPVNDRAVTHVDNAYQLPNVRITSHRCRTHTQSATAFRGFGGPQGMFPIEHAMDEIAHLLGLDPLEVRKRNFYGADPGPLVTPYSMPVEDNVLQLLVARLEVSADYARRASAVAAWNASQPLVKRGLGWMPVKYGIAYNAIFLNQASATVQIYVDGSLMVHHGGTEMGQGLYVKLSQVVAQVFGVAATRVKTTAAETAKIPNASATSASSGADLNGMAAHNAACILRERLVAWACERHGVAPHEVRFEAGEVIVGAQRSAFAAFVRAAYLQRVQLMATGFYKVPKIYYEPGSLHGRPYLYFAYGVALTEVAVDLLTGELRVLRADLLQDAGRSMNPAIDTGQVAGGFVQGLGWLTTEELHWKADGRLATHSPSTYKIPLASDVPPVFNVQLWSEGRNLEDTVYRSKATGEPPLPLALSVYSAVRHALAAQSPAGLPQIDAPLTPQRVALAVDRDGLMRQAAALATAVEGVP